MEEYKITKNYCSSFFKRERYKTRSVYLSTLGIGGEHPIRIQSMTTTDTMDTNASVEESIRMINAGCEIVRLTAPSKKEAQNLLPIKNELRKRGYSTPLVADIHFTPNAAEVAANIVEKVRINPGNFADKKKFEQHNYTDEDYKNELLRIEEKFTPLILLCKKNNVAMRIGTNHGSLSDRILSRFGDTPEGMVESAMEFLRICIKNEYHSVVLSMKASNTLVMVKAYRLLVSKMKEFGMNYPLHLGVTEAGEGEDGRIKSAVGIGALLEDGIGDTIRVSLTEKPEAEIPIAKKLLAKFNKENCNEFYIKNKTIAINYDPFHYNRRNTREILNIGNHHLPVVFADVSQVDEIKPSHLFGFGYSYSAKFDKWSISDSAADYLYIGNQQINFKVPGTLRLVCDFEKWNNSHRGDDKYVPLITKDKINRFNKEDIFFVKHTAEDGDISYLKEYLNAIIVLNSSYTNITQLYRYFWAEMGIRSLKNPVILCNEPKVNDKETFQLWSSSNLGSLFIDGFGDGIWLKGNFPRQLINSTSFGILQATRRRISKTEYISCPSCGRTLFNLQETTSKIREKTAHLKGLKIGIMGCIVNGPGEMADADYGYVGTGVGKIHLYKEKTVVRKNVPEKEAVNALIELIKENGDWVEKNE